MRLRLNTLGIILGSFFGVVYGVSVFIFWHQGDGPFIYYQQFATWVPIILVSLMVTGWYWRKTNGDNPLTFIQGLQFAFLAYIIFELITLVANVILHNFLDTGLYDRGLLFSMNEQKQYNVNHGASPGEIKQIQDSIDYTTSHPQKGMPTVQILLGFGEALMGAFFKAMLVGFIIQKKDVKAAISRGNA